LCALARFQKLSSQGGEMVADTSGPRKVDSDPSPPEGAMSRGEEVYVEGYKDLCASCAKRDSCTVSKSEGGVWHCEEYVEC
jgi:hypothetical protein